MPGVRDSACQDLALFLNALWLYAMHTLSGPTNLIDPLGERRLLGLRSQLQMMWSFSALLSLELLLREEGAGEVEVQTDTLLEDGPLSLLLRQQSHRATVTRLGLDGSQKWHQGFHFRPWARCPGQGRAR